MAGLEYDESLNVSKYGGEHFQRFYEIYDKAHLPLSSIICLFGVVTNTLNVCVLTRPSMVSPINIILTGLSISQLCLVSNYFVLLMFNVCADSCEWPSLHSYSAVTYKWLNVNLNVVFHKIAFTHTLILALARFLALKAPTFSRTSINAHTSKMVVLITYILLPVLCTPMFFMSYVAEKPSACGLEVTYDLEYRDSPVLIQVDMWLFSVVFKLIPSSAIAVLSFFLISSLKSYDRKKAKLTRGPSNLVALAGSLRRKACEGKKRARKKQTKMLVMVALFCASVELPHGMVNLLTAIFGRQFAHEVYDNVGDLFEMLTLLYSSVNFLLYCLMNKDYQETFARLFRDPSRWRTTRGVTLLTEV